MEYPPQGKWKTKVKSSTIATTVHVLANGEALLNVLPRPQVLEILQSADATNLYSPEVEREKKKQTNAVTTDLLGALLAVSVLALWA